MVAVALQYPLVRTSCGGHAASQLVHAHRTCTLSWLLQFTFQCKGVCLPCCRLARACSRWSLALLPQAPAILGDALPADVADAQHLFTQPPDKTQLQSHAGGPAPMCCNAQLASACVILPLNAGYSMIGAWMLTRAGVCCAAAAARPSTTPTLPPPTTALTPQQQAGVRQALLHLLRQA